MPDIEVGGRFGRLYGWLDWPIRLVGLNVLWVAGVLAGLVIGGLAPSTSALYSVLRGYLLRRPVRLWPDFWAAWRRGIWSSQLVLGVPLLTVWVLVFYLLAARGTPLVFGLAVVLVLYVATLLQLPAVAAHLDLAPVAVWRASVEVAWRRPLPTLGVAGLVGVIVLGAWFTTPAALPLFVPAVPALLATVVSRAGLPPAPATPQPSDGEPAA